MISKAELIEALPLAQDYQEIRIPKKKGGFRTISIPSPELKKVQRKILRFLGEIFRRDYEGIFGLRSGSYIEHAKAHSGSRFIFLFDLKDAFPSVDISKLREVLIHRFISTYIFSIYGLEAVEFGDLILQLTSFKQTLPQGAPTSPFLFWIAITNSGLLKKLSELCPFGWKISGYVDGFVISGQKPLSPEIKEKILKCVGECGFQINPKKIRQLDCRQGSPMICGIRVNGRGRVSLPKKTIRKWRGIIHRASFNPNPELRKEIVGFMASLKPIYGHGIENLPPQIVKPLVRFHSSLIARQIPKAKPVEPLEKPKSSYLELKQTRLTDWL